MIPQVDEKQQTNTQEAYYITIFKKKLSKLRIRWLQSFLLFCLFFRLYINDCTQSGVFKIFLKKYFAYFTIFVNFW